ncbi:FAD-binding oxidoreductase [Pseudonocardia cypriaca]|uniref:FAD/FMN-containing dehydrogenase n=1 Tax=Pseudonocardia cypriaca TaxID=882449 RepID=A0A543GCY9_9PSEU|nr:FAD-binding oxidoreductase [Pseudonocardia cypriaca]TQM43942.1 FAD/FMN-containing dehydrogenase [Pseudonocardia cypriaca]
MRDVLTPGHPRYDAERTGFNRVVDHRPALVVVPADVADVRAAVRHAAHHDLPIAIHATGHGVTVPADGTLMIATRRLDAVSVDPVARTATVAAGVRWRQVIDAAAPHGLAPLNGSSPSVGAVSYTLGGGLGPVARTFGYAADHVRRFRLVTADGELRTVTPDEHPELFWALRGGKSGFGVVVEMEIGLVPLPRLYGGALFFDGADAARVVAGWREWLETVPEELTSSLALLRLPADAPPPLRGRFVVHVRIAYTGPAADGERLLRPLRALAAPVVDDVGEMPYRDVAAIHRDPDGPLAYHEHSALLHHLDAAGVDAFLAVAVPAAADHGLLVELRHLGGALARPPEVPSAIDRRDAAFCLMALTPAGADPHPRRLLLKAIAPWATGGVYVNFLSGPDAAADIPRAHTPPTRDRLRAIRRTYDPAGRFHRTPEEAS